MVKISMFKDDKGRLLVIRKTPKEKLIGELYNNGIEKRGDWISRATFEGKEATEHRVCEYYGFDSSKPYWKRWA